MNAVGVAGRRDSKGLDSKAVDASKNPSNEGTGDGGGMLRCRGTVRFSDGSLRYDLIELTQFESSNIIHIGNAFR